MQNHGAGDGGGERQRHGHRAHFQEAQEANMHAFAAQRDEPEDGGERAGHGEVRPKVHGDEHGMGNETVGVHESEGAAGDQAQGQVVDQVVDYADHGGG